MKMEMYLNQTACLNATRATYKWSPPANLMKALPLKIWVGVGGIFPSHPIRNLLIGL